jgi:hypothetical protein
MPSTARCLYLFGVYTVRRLLCNNLWSRYCSWLWHQRLKFAALSVVVQETNLVAQQNVSIKSKMAVNLTAHHYGLNFAPHIRGTEYLMQVADPLSGTYITVVNLDTHTHIHTLSLFLQHLGSLYRLMLPILADLETTMLCSVLSTCWWSDFIAQRNKLLEFWRKFNKSFICWPLSTENSSNIILLPGHVTV